jgi:hypothetical protein
MKPKSMVSEQVPQLTILLFACSRPFYSFATARCIPIVGLCCLIAFGPYLNSFSKPEFSWHFTCDSSAIENAIEKQSLRKMPTNKRKRWSKHVTAKSNALDLEQGIFSKKRSTQYCTFTQACSNTRYAT